MLAWLIVITMAMRLAAASGKGVVVGGGYGGLAAAHHLLQTSGCAGVTLYDDYAVTGSKASLVSAGLLHPLTPSGKLMWMGAEALSESLSLLEHAQHSSSRDVRNKGVKIVRPFYSQKELDAWTASSHTPAVAPYLQMRSPEHFLREQYGDEVRGELFADIKGAAELTGSVCVNSGDYLAGLLSSLSKRSNFEVVNRKIDINDLADVAASAPFVILAAGPGIMHLWEGEPALPVKCARGQNLLIRSGVDALRRNALLSGEYLIPSGADAHIFGATYEYGDEQQLHRGPDAQEALSLLSGKFSELLGCADTALLGKAEVVGCLAGVRVVARRTNVGKLPIVRRHSRLRNVWLLSGLGSRGLLYHALVAKWLAAAAVAGDEALIPKELL